MNTVFAGDLFHSVVCNLGSRFCPSVDFFSLSHFPHVKCVLSVCNSDAFNIATLIRVFVDYRNEFRRLAIALRFWAKVRQRSSPLQPSEFPPPLLQTIAMDNARVGALPAYAFDLMLIHFLQQVDYLPVLHEVGFDFESWK
jgi:DNA polymerase sigma